MNLAIQHREGSFSDRWIKYCQENHINYLLINVFDTNIIAQLKKQEITHFMWHINHGNTKDLMVYHYLMNSIENIGIQCFPNFNTRWHFDDKIAQKYLLESIDAPLVESYVFYDKNEAFQNLKDVSFPIVTKLKRGAGATNVQLLTNMSETVAFVNKMFSEGLNSSSGVLGNFDQKLRLAKKIKSPFKLIKKVFGYLKKYYKEANYNINEKGYFYYQKFLENNNFDIRVIVIGDKAFAIKRMNRKDDFRASGSGIIVYDHSQIDERCVLEAFNTNKKLNLQCTAYDFVFDENNAPLIVEIGFGFAVKAYDRCPGYWTSDLKWHHQNFNPQAWMIENFLNS